MKIIGNILWHFPFFGFITASLVYIFGLLLTITVVASPIGLGLMQLGKFLFWPFGQAMISKAEIETDQNLAWKGYSTIIRVLYFPFGLLFVVIGSIQAALMFITIIGIPVALVIAKSLGTYLNPINKVCVASAVVDELERRKAMNLNTPVGDTKVCPKCAEEVKINAHICKHCSHEFDIEAEAKAKAEEADAKTKIARAKTAKTREKSIKVLAVLILFGVIVANFIPMGTEERGNVMYEVSLLAWKLELFIMQMIYHY